jgi:hypothetical protein
VTTANETDLLPWILGSSIILASVIAIVIVTAARMTSEPATHAAPSAAPKPEIQAAALPPIADQTTARPPLPRGQVWQCVAKGQPTFSDSPCSNSASVRQLSQVNRMDAVVVPVPAASYNWPVPEYTPSFPDPNTADSGNDSSFCKGLKAEVSSINERMRHGYSLPEGEVLRARLRKISDIQYERSCLR